MLKRRVYFGSFLGIVIYTFLYILLKKYSVSIYPAIFNTIVQVLLDSFAVFFCFKYLNNLRGLTEDNNKLIVWVLLALSVLMLVVNLTWGISANFIGVSSGGQLSVLLNRIPYFLVLLLWVTFWTLNLSILPSKISVIVICGIATIILSSGLAFLFWDYIKGFGVSPTFHREASFFVYSYIGLELLGLILCIGSSASGNTFPFLIGISYIIMVSADLFFNAYEITGTISKNSLAEIPWTISQVFLVLGTVFFFQKATKKTTSVNFKSFSIFLLSLPVIISICFSAFVAILLYTQKDLQIATMLFLICGMALTINLTLPVLSPQIEQLLISKNMKKKIQTILFLAANPNQTTPLDLEEELRSLESELRGVHFRDRISLVSHHAVRPDDLIRYIRKYSPTVVHFSGHGNIDGIILRNDEGGWTPVSGIALKKFFKDRGVKLVVLNSCFSKHQANEISESVSSVIGTFSAVGDLAARKFTIAFYRALGDGFTIEEAFRDGSDAISLYGLQDVFEKKGKTDQPLFNHN